MAKDLKYVSMEDILGRSAADLSPLKEGEFETEKLGVIPFTSIDHSEYKQAKQDAVKFVPNGTGGMIPEVDDDKMMVRIIIRAVDKDKRSDFTFANKQLLDHLGVTTADQAVAALLSPGEIVNFAVAIQDASGFGPKKKKQEAELVKNS
jgi:hypothetical protein